MEKENVESTETKKNDDDALMKKLKFRNYNPRSEELKKYVEETEPADTELKRMQEEYDKMMSDANAKFNNPVTDLDIIVPKKVNWDLKMQIAPKLKTLQRQTHRALLEMAREKVAGGAGIQLVSAVAQASQVSSNDDDDDDDDDLFS